MSLEVNWTWVFIGAIIAMVIGAAWYGAFAQAWMKALGKSKEDLKSTGMNYLWGFVFGLVWVYVLAVIISLWEATSFAAGATAGFWLWVAVSAIMAGNINWESRSWNLWLINAGYYLVSMLVIGGLLAMYPA